MWWCSNADGLTMIILLPNNGFEPTLPCVERGRHLRTRHRCSRYHLTLFFHPLATELSRLPITRQRPVDLYLGLGRSTVTGHSRGELHTAAWPARYHTISTYLGLFYLPVPHPCCPHLPPLPYAPHLPLSLLPSLTITTCHQPPVHRYHRALLTDTVLFVGSRRRGRCCGDCRRTAAIPTPTYLVPAAD